MAGVMDDGAASTAPATTDGFAPPLGDRPTPTIPSLSKRRPRAPTPAPSSVPPGLKDRRVDRAAVRNQDTAATLATLS